MTQRNKQEVTFYDNVTPVAIASSTDASPAVITTTGAHGLTTGQRVLVFGHTTNIAVNGIYRAVVVSSTTFSLVDEFTGVAVNGSGAGAGASGAVCTAPSPAYVEDFTNVDFQIDTSGSATMTIKSAISQGKPVSASTSPRYDYPNFGATISVSNPYSFIQDSWLDNNSSVPGSTGIVLAGTDVHKTYEVNGNLQKYFVPLLTSWTAGAITLKGIFSSI